ncbi:unnamed protein product [Oreochromis niloticus]|nr:unnamed protein product [Mustela putorius furo]
MGRPNSCAFTSEALEKDVEGARRTRSNGEPEVQLEGGVRVIGPPQTSAYSREEHKPRAVFVEERDKDAEGARRTRRHGEPEVQTEGGVRVIGRPNSCSFTSEAQENDGEGARQTRSNGEPEVLTQAHLRVTQGPSGKALTCEEQENGTEGGRRTRRQRESEALACEEEENGAEGGRRTLRQGESEVLTEIRLREHCRKRDDDDDDDDDVKLRVVSSGGSGSLQTPVFAIVTYECVLGLRNTPSWIFDLLPLKKSSGIPYEVQDAAKCLNVRPKRYVLPYPSQEQNDAYAVFQKVGLKMATNLLIRLPSCVKFKGKVYHEGPRVAAMVPWDGDYSVQLSSPRLGSAGNLPPEAAPIETVRSFFPETWIWDLVEVGDDGKRGVSLTVPDTITTWETEAFCLSSQGFGLAPRKEMKVFQPFFLELTMPYSIIRGEHFELKATVFNYLTSCIMVTVTPGPSSDYTLTPLSGDLYTSCLCANERKTLRWTMIPTALGAVNVTVSAEAVASHVSCDNEVVSVPDRGRIDVVTKSLIVKAEGTEMTKTYNWLLCPKGSPLTEEAEIHLPENVIEGSARTSVSVLGDILGRALKNLDGLLQMPYGCGEQNMALLAPNIYILHYTVTTAIMEKATNFLTSGYQRQLNYKSADGAYTTFGTGPGNTWLTAFVVRSFAKAQSFVYIDPRKIEESKSWLQHKQQENGCFEKSGKLFNNRMKGGVSDEVTLSAYVTAAFLEMNTSQHDPVMKKSLACLKESLSDLSNTYTTALLAYVFTLAGDVETRAHLLQHLDTVAVREGGFLYWSQTAAETSASLSVEISSYVLLAKLSASPTAEDLGYVSGIIRWLTGQQNYYGGFSSTQDTVVALQALALYSTLVFSPEGWSTVTVQAPSSQLTFDVNQSNKLLYQEEALQDVSGKYSLEVKGTACASVQISATYNIPTPADVTTLSVKVQLEVNTTSESARPKFTVQIQSLYNGKEKTTNMVILDIKMLSGFSPDPESLKSLKHGLLVSRVEQKEDHVLVYLEELPKDTPINHSLDIIQELPVDNLKPAVVKIYDYYQPGDQAETQYMFVS